MPGFYSAANMTERERLRAAWPDAPVMNPDLCTMLLDVAEAQVMAYAPTPDAAGLTAEQTSRYAWAQLQQVKSLWNAGRAAPGSIGGDFQYEPRPLDTEIRAIIRPKRGVPNVF